MSKATDSPFQALEAEAYHAFREWPVWLALRERELAGHLRPPHNAAQAAGAGAKPAQQPGHTPLDKRGD